MKYVKIIDSTRDSIGESFIGEVVDVKTIEFEEGYIVVKHKSNLFFFNLSDVQECVLDKDDTPVYYEGEPVCVGDEINGNKIIGWYIYDNRTALLVGSKSNTVSISLSGITTHTPKYKTKKDLVVSLKEVAEKFGVDVKDLKINYD